MKNTYKVKQIGLWTLNDSWGDTTILFDTEIYVVKNFNGNYQGPFKVKVVSVPHYESQYNAGFMILIDTHIDSYYSTVGHLDFIGNTKESCWERFKKYLK